MSERHETLAARIDERFGEQMRRVDSSCGELTYELDKDDLHEIATALRNEGDFGFEMLMDVCGVDYLGYGSDEWTTSEATGSGFSRGVERKPVILDEADEFDARMGAEAVYELRDLGCELLGVERPGRERRRSVVRGERRVEVGEGDVDDPRCRPTDPDLAFRARHGPLERGLPRDIHQGLEAGSPAEFLQPRAGVDELGLAVVVVQQREAGRAVGGDGREQGNRAGGLVGDGEERLIRMPEGPQVQVVVGSRIEYIDALHAMAEEMAKLAGLPDDDRFHFAMAVRIRSMIA